MCERAFAHHAHRRSDVRAELQERSERIGGKQLEAGGGAEETKHASRQVEHRRFGKSIGAGEVAAHRVHVVVRRRRAFAMLEGVDCKHRDARACRRVGGGKARHAACIEPVMRNDHGHLRAGVNRRQRQQERYVLTRTSDDLPLLVAQRRTDVRTGAAENSRCDEVSGDDVADRAMCD